MAGSRRRPHRWTRRAARRRSRHGARDGSGSRLHFHLEGPATGERKPPPPALPRACASRCSPPTSARSPSVPGDVDATLDVLIGRAQLLNAVLFLDDLDALLAVRSRRGRRVAAASASIAARQVVIAAGERPCSVRFPTLTAIAVAEPGFHERSARCGRRKRAPAVSAPTTAPRRARVALPADGHRDSPRRERRRQAGRARRRSAGRQRSRQLRTPSGAP